MMQDLIDLSYLLFAVFSAVKAFGTPWAGWFVVGLVYTLKPWTRGQR